MSKRGMIAACGLHLSAGSNQLCFVQSATSELVVQQIGRQKNTAFQAVLAALCGELMLLFESRRKAGEQVKPNFDRISLSALVAFLPVLQPRVPAAAATPQ